MSEEDLAILSEEVVEDEPVSEDECIQIKKPVKKKVYKKKEPIEGEEPKPKRERTQAQKDAWAKCLANRTKNRENRKVIQDEDEKLLAEYKKQLSKKTETKIVKKAIGIKKKQIVREEEIDEISEDETPIEVVKEIIKKRRQPVPKKQLPAREPEPEPLKRVLTFF
jgi:N-methylhydantoinase B/oxoprolinase/acetone carboxylase alpha subunit